MKIITGMHRSGTSLIANLFHEAGADMGTPETFYRADRWNPRGYYEQPDIHEINMPLINGPWWKFAYFRLPSSKTILKRGQNYSGQIKAMGEKYRGKIVKETRFCLTLPSWLSCGVEVDKILICIRAPNQVVRSIQKRNFTTLSHGYYLWHLHNERIFQYTEGIPNWIVDYNRVLDQETYEEEMSAALHFLGFNLSKKHLMALRKKVVHSHMNHNSEQICKYPLKVQILWDTLRERHTDQFKRGRNCDKFWAY